MHREQFLILLNTKFLLLAITWGLAFAVSLGLRLWGLEHPQPFNANSFVLLVLLFAPSIILAFWIFLVGFPKTDSE